MIRMRITVMMVPVIMPMSVIMVVIMVVMMVPMVMIMPLIQTAGAGAEMIAQLTILDIASRGRHTLPLDMVMVALLRHSNLILEAKNLRPVFAHGAVHVVAAFEDLAHAVSKGGNHLGMVV